MDLCPAAADRPVRGLPPAAALDGLQDPYAGVGAQARFGWQPQDVFGNRLLAQQHIDVDVGYTDDLVALSQWPAVVTGYRFAGTPGAATVEVGVALDTSAYVPAPGEVFTPVAAPGTASLPVGVAAQATAHRDRYAAVFWQLSHDLAAEVTTTVDNTAHPVDVAALAAFASGAWSYLATVAGTTQLTATTAAGDTLASIAATYQVSAAELAQANRSPAQSFAAASLLRQGATIAVERRYTVVPNDTLAGIAQRSPVPADPAGLAASNAALALQPGTLLALGTVRTVAVGDTLSGLAAAAALDRTQLASANGPVTGLLEPGTAITPDYQVATGDTLAGIAGRLSLTLREVAAAVDAAGVGALVSGAGIVVPLPVPVAVGDTLAGVARRFAVTAAELGETNADADALSPSAPVVLPDGSQVTVAAHDTLGSIAAAHGTTAGDLAAANATAGGLLRPGAVLTSGYRARAGDTPGGVAAAFGLTAAALGAANAEVPGLLAADQSVLLGQDSRPVGQGDTFASIAADTGVTVASLAAANATAAGLLEPGQTVAVPRHVVLGGSAHQAGPADTMGAIAGRSGVQVTALGSANSDVTGLLAAGVELSYTPPGARPYATTTTAHDTLSTVALRLQPQLAADGITQQVTPALLAEANQQVACLVPGAALLVPPADVALSAPVTASNPAVVFALETSVTLRRTAHVDPALAAAGAAELASVTTPLAPAPPEGAAGQSLALQQFASAFESAFTTPRLKLATTGSGSSGTQTQQLFAVQYGTPALSYTIGGTPSFYAPAPLSTALWSSAAPIPIRGYTRGQPLGPAQPTSFTGVDLDGWARAFLTDLDLVLSSDYAVAAYTLDPARYHSLVQAKHDLAGALRDSVTSVLDPAQAPAGDLDGAREALYQRVLVTLSTAYQVETIVQLPVTVTAPADWSGDTAPRLRGQPAAATYLVPAGATLQSVATDFGAPPERLAAELADYAYLLVPGAQVSAAQIPGVQGQPYTVTSGDTLARVAAHFGVTVAQLAGALAGEPGLLEPGAAVSLVRRAYPLAADDTLFSALSYLALDVATAAGLAAAVDNFAAMNATLPGLFAAGVTLQVPALATVAPGDTIASLAAARQLTALGLATSFAARTDVLAANVTVTLGGQDVTTAPGDSLDGLAVAAGLTLDAVVAAVQAIPGLLRPGTVLALPGTETSHQVQADDTLTTIAAAAGQGATPSWIVTTQLHTAQVLHAGTTVSYLSRVAGFSLSDASISLADSHQHPSPNSLTFLFSTASNTAFSNLAVQLSYQVNQLEYGIQDVSWASGYQSSQWLTFLLPPDNVGIGTVDVPIPLRAHPVPPSVTGQRITPQVTAAQPTSALQQLRRYDYDYSFSAQRAAQDSLSTSQLQNSALSGGTPLTGPVDALPAALAQYAAVRDGLDQDLALLTQVNPAAPVTVIAAAGDTLATLAQSAAVDVGYLGGVNAFATGLLQADGTLIVAGQPPVTVTASDTLAGIAARLGTDVGAVATAAAGLPLTTGAAVVRPRPGDRPAWQALQVFTDLAVPVAQAWAARVAPAPGLLPAAGQPVAVLPQVAGFAAVPRSAPRYQLRRGTLATGEPTVHLRPDGDAAAVHADDLVVGLRGHIPVGGSGHAGRRQVAFTRLARPSADASVPADPALPLPDVDEFDLLVPDRDVITTQNIWGEVTITRNANLLAGLSDQPGVRLHGARRQGGHPRRAAHLVERTVRPDLSPLPAPRRAGVCRGRCPAAGRLADQLLRLPAQPLRGPRRRHPGQDRGALRPDTRRAGPGGGGRARAAGGRVAASAAGRHHPPGGQR